LKSEVFKKLPAISRKKKYLRSKGMICPYCGISSIAGGTPEVFDNCIGVPVSCNLCNKEWTDVYALTAVEFPEDKEA
jgi:hypothetical protein